MGTPWFASWFDSVHYDKLYAHRDAAEAATFVDELVSRLNPVVGTSALDLGCGSGRHAQRLASRGLDVTGLDLAASSIRRAQALAGRGLRFRRHDMRVPFGRCVFDYVFNFFTSFGYFDAPSEHLGVVRNISDALKPGGHVVLDYLNVAYADAHMVPQEVSEIDGTTYRIRRWTDRSHFFKQVAIDDGGGAPRECQEQVARFSLEDFRRMFGLAGLDIVQVYGDYRLNPYDAGASPRLVMVGEKRA